MFNRKILVFTIFIVSLVLGVSSVSATDNLMNETIEDSNEISYYVNTTNNEVNDVITSNNSENQNINFNELIDEYVSNNSENQNVLNGVNDLVFSNTYTPIYSNSIGTWNGSDSDIPSSYDLRKEGFVTSVKDQNPAGTCWAFAAIGALESCVLKATGIEYDFSEENLKNLATDNSIFGRNDHVANGGGYSDMAISYLTDWIGAVNEANDPYTYGTRTTSDKLNNVINIQNVYIIPKNSDKNVIKRAILNYGAVASSYYHNDTYLNGVNYYNYEINNKTNHEIVIVGWNDNSQVWICKNSWGYKWGDNGYFYISYDDVSLAKIGDSYTFILNDSTKYNKNYQYDTQKITLYDGFYFRNVFTSTGYETLVSVSSYFDKDITYTIYIKDKYGNEVDRQDFRSNIDGYFTVKLDKTLTLWDGDKFEVIIKNPNGYFSVCHQNYVKKELQKGVSFVSYDYRNWQETLSNRGYVNCIKAFTITNGGNLKDRGLTLVSNDVRKFYHGDEKLVITLENDGALGKDGSNLVSWKPINIMINGVPYVRYTNGIGQINMGINLGAGVYDADISYNNLKTHVKVTVLSTIEATDIIKYYRNGTQYSAKFFDTKGNVLINTKVTFNINGVFYEKTTDSNGIASLNINLAPNDTAQNFTITAHNFNSSEDKGNNITVESTVIVDNFEKWFGTSKQYTAKVVDGQGNPLANQIVQFNINGRVYSKTTDSNGIARQNINLNPGTYTITTYYNGIAIGKTINVY